MTNRSIFAALLLLLGLAAPAAAASLAVKGETFVLTLPNGRQLGSADLVGAELQTSDGQTIRIDAVAPAKDRPGVLLHTFSTREGQMEV